MTIIIPVGYQFADRLNNLDKSWLLNKGCVLWFRGKTTTDFPILPSGVTATPSGTWTNDLTLNNRRIVKTFNGSDTGITYSTNSAWQLNGDFTISFWIKIITAPDSAWPSIWFGPIQNTTRYACINYETRSSQGSKRGIYLYAVDNSNSVLIGTLDDANYITNWVGSFHNVTFTRSGTTIYLYKNATLVTTTNSSIIISGTTQSQSLGFLWDGGNAWHINANIKDFLIFKGCALSQPEITYLYNTTKKYLVK
jgi:hypothetical protein